MSPSTTRASGVDRLGAAGRAPRMHLRNNSSASCVASPAHAASRQRQIEPWQLVVRPLCLRIAARPPPIARFGLGSGLRRSRPGAAAGACRPAVCAALHPASATPRRKSEHEDAEHEQRNEHSPDRAGVLRQRLPHRSVPRIARGHPGTRCAFSSYRNGIEYMRPPLVHRLLSPRASFRSDLAPTVRSKISP